MTIDVERLDFVALSPHNNMRRQDCRYGTEMFHMFPCIVCLIEVKQSFLVPEDQHGR